MGECKKENMLFQENKNQKWSGECNTRAEGESGVRIILLLNSTNQHL